MFQKFREAVRCHPTKMFLKGHFFLVLILATSLLKAEEPEDPIVSVETVKVEDDVAYLTPNLHPDVYFADHFDDEEQFKKKWIKSQAKKAGAEEAIAKYDGEWSLEKAQKDPLTGDLGLVMKSKAKHAAISAPLGKVFKFDDKPFIVQYELNFQVLKICQLNFENNSSSWFCANE